MKQKHSTRFLPARDQIGRFAIVTYGVWRGFAVILTFLLLMAIALYHVDRSRARNVVVPAKETEVFECMWIHGGYACNDKNAIIDALMEQESICGLEDVVCDEEKSVSFKAIRTRYSRADSCHYPKDGKCLTAIGKDTEEGRTIACPRNIALGTRLLIEEKEYVCEDRYATWLDGKRGLPTIDVFAEADTLHALPAYKQVLVTVLH